jgi:hypothetical protein
LPPQIPSGPAPESPRASSLFLRCQFTKDFSSGDDLNFASLISIYAIFDLVGP